MSYISIPEPSISKFLFADTRMAWFWLVVRIYVGWQWLEAGWSKFNNEAWIGQTKGEALSNFILRSLEKAQTTRPDVTSWYAWFLENLVLPYVDTWSLVITFGELLVGLGLILGVFTGIAAFFGLFMNYNFLLAGTISSNPVLLLLSIGIVLAWRVAGYLGFDRYLLPKLGVPWR